MKYGTGMMLVLTAGLVWSFQGLIIRQIDDAGSWTVLFWRSMSMIPVLLALVSLRAGGSPLPAIRKAGMAGVVGGVGLVAAMGGAILAFQTTTIANACFLFAASPFLTAILARTLLGEAVTPRTWAAMGIAALGILVMVSDGLAAGAWLGNVAALTSALGFAAFTVALRWRRVEDSLPTSLLGAVFAAIAGGVVAVQAGQPLAVPAPDLFWCVLMGLGTMSGGMILYTLGSKVVPSAELTLLSNSEILLAPVWVWLVMGETASEATLAGGAILLTAILFNAYSGVRRLQAA